MSNFITNINTCIPSATAMMNGNLNLIYYSHIPALVISMIIGFFVIINNRKSISSRVVFVLSLLLSVWLLSSLITWVSPNSISILFFWSLFGILDSSLFLVGFYLLYTFKSDVDLKLWLKIFLATVFLPIILMTPTKFNVDGFDYDNCTANDNLFLHYVMYFKIFVTILILILSIYKIGKSNKGDRKQVIFMSSGVILFLGSIFVTEYISDTYGIYAFYVYGVFAMTLFLGFLAYLIVKFKAFNIKLLGAQALVWAVVILVGSEFFFVTGLANQILVGVTLVFSSILGLNLVRGVKKEDVLNEQLAVANTGQKNLIHIMNHQIKGYLSIDKNIFAELLTDDYGKVPEEAKDIASKGLKNADDGQKYVTDILRGASAESGTLVYDKQLFDFKVLVSEVFEKTKAMVEKKGLKFNLDIANGEYDIKGDESHLAEAIRNLIENSAHYTSAGSISVSLKRVADKIIFAVKDTGVGIKPEDKEKMFKAGGVSADSIKINTSSSGYGLAFVKGVADAHKGKVWFESAGAGKGATFYMELPVK